MAALSSIYIKKETLETLLKVLEQKKEKGVNITISQGDVDKFGQNVSSYVSQSKDEREEKRPRYYVGNGKVFWTDGEISVAPKKEDVQTDPVESVQVSEQSDLPF